MSGWVAVEQGSCFGRVCEATLVIATIALSRPILDMSSAAGNTRASRLHDMNGGLPPRFDRQAYDSASFTSRLEAFGNRTLSDESTYIRNPPEAAGDRIAQFATFQANDVATQGSLCGAHDSLQQAAINPTPDFSMPRPGTPPPRSPVPKQQSGLPALNNITPKGQTGSNVEWTLDEVKTRLSSYWQDVRDGHSQLTGYILETTKATDRRVHRGVDLFANVQIPSVPEKKGTTMRVKSKVKSKTSWHQVAHACATGPIY